LLFLLGSELLNTLVRIIHVMNTFVCNCFLCKYCVCYIFSITAVNELHTNKILTNLMRQKLIKFQ
jgi:hypothetical protein